MKDIQFHYSSKQKRLYLILGLLQLGIGLFSLSLESGEYLSFLTGLGLVYIAQAVYYYRIPYIEVRQGILVKNELLRKRLSLDRLVSVSCFTDEYTLKSEGKELIINYNLIDKKEREDFFHFMRQLKNATDKDEA